MSKDEQNRDEHDESVPDRVPAVEPTDEEEDEAKKKKDATVDHASEQSMDGSDPPAW